MTAAPPGQPIRSRRPFIVLFGDDGDTQMKGAMGTEFSGPVPKLDANG
jgi:hypothetical protein